MDSSALNPLVSPRRRLDAEGGRLTITGVHPQPIRLLQITGVDDLFATDTTAAGGATDALTGHAGGVVNAPMHQRFSSPPGQARRPDQQS
jgi:hypothetical protein